MNGWTCAGSSERSADKSRKLYSACEGVADDMVVSEDNGGGDVQSERGPHAQAAASHLSCIVL